MRRLIVVAAVVGLLAACADTGDDTATRPTADSAPSTTASTPASTADAPGPPALTATDTGVTETAIRLGAIFPDTALLGRDPGDLEAKFRTIADTINDAGGINGRLIELHFQALNPLDDAPFETACVEMVEDIGVFAAIGLFPRGTADCYARLNDTIVISAFAITEEQMADYTAPGITIAAHPGRLVDTRISTLVDGGVLAPGMKVAVHGAELARADHERYLAALAAAGVDVVADTVALADGQDQLALTAEMQRFSEVWRSSGAEVVVASNALMSQGLLIAYNDSDLDLPMVLPEGTGVDPSLLRNQLGLDLTPFETAVALVEGADQASKYGSGADGVRECVDSFEAGSGEDVALDESRNNLAPTIVACQVFDIFVQIATAAGPDLTTESFRAAAETFGPIEVTDVGAASLGPGKFDLDDTVGVIGTYDPERLQFVPTS